MAETLPPRSSRGRAVAPDGSTRELHSLCRASSPAENSLGPSGAVIGVLIDKRRVLEAAALLLQLNATGTLLPRIFFCHSPFRPGTRAFCRASAGRWCCCARICPSRLTSRGCSGFATRRTISVAARWRGASSASGRTSSLQRLSRSTSTCTCTAGWTRWRSSPPDTFSPNICSYGCDHLSGYNAGVAVIAPSRRRYDHLVQYALRRAAGWFAALLPRKVHHRRSRRGPPLTPLEEMLQDHDQSFVAEFFAEGLAIEADGPAREGYKRAHPSQPQLHAAVGRFCERQFTFTVAEERARSGAMRFANLAALGLPQTTTACAPPAAARLHLVPVERTLP